MIGTILSLIGSAGTVIGCIGLLRFPDVYTRSHAQTVVMVSGITLILLGIFIETLETAISWKIIIIILLIFIASPTATHAITKSAYKTAKRKSK